MEISVSIEQQKITREETMASENVKTLDKGNFHETISNSKTPVLIDFWAAWCGPCRAVAPVIESIAEEYGDELFVGKFNVDENEAIVTELRITGIPTVILFKDGEALETLVGAMKAKDYKTIIDKHL